MLKKEIDQFFEEKQIAFVGISRNEAKFSNKVYQELKKSGYIMHPVHLEMTDFDDDKCVPSVHQLPSDVQALMIVASPDVAFEVLSEVSESNIKHVWVFTGKKNPPDVNMEINDLRTAGVDVITELCPFMFIEPVESFHAFHRFFAKLFGKYPK